ncbi:short-subunit dehydrogenase [Sphingomonas trueperi]|uniref:oxidoreductase n=1 Tax=Sphingomonas trueperi TaxID=53317 RepID=UPI00339B7402
MQENDRVALVTGASTGIGLATAKLLAACGYRVFGTSRRPRENIDRVTMLACDVTDTASVEAAVAAASQAGPIRLLVNNAGVGLLGGLEESSIAQAEDLFAVNLFAVIRAVKAVLPQMRAQGEGRILNISSVLGFLPAPYSALYAASKHALEGLSESLDHELRGFGIRVSLIEPAYTQTAFEANLVVPDTPLDAYAEARANAQALMRDVMVQADPPELVAAAVLKAATARAPRHRYTVGKVARQVSLLRRFVPEGAFDKSFRKQMRLPA